MLKQTLLFTILSIMPAVSGELVFSFKNPSFSGEGWSSHVLTIENQEYARKKSIEADRKAKEDALASAATNTNLNKFLNNLESRIYAQLSLQLSNAMFADGSTTGTLDFQGSTISWIKDSTAGTIALTIIDDKGSRTEIVVPTGSFKF
jgi:hypothetical protein